jgi:hypothetical protein
MARVDVLQQAREGDLVRGVADAREGAQLLERLDVPVADLEDVRLGGEAVGQVFELGDAVCEADGELVVQELGGENQLALDRLGAKVEPVGGRARVGGEGGMSASASASGGRRERRAAAGGRAAGGAGISARPGRRFDSRSHVLEADTRLLLQRAREDVVDDLLGEVVGQSDRQPHALLGR